MTDNTSDDLLNQPEPAEGDLVDDPVVDMDAAQTLSDHLRQAQKDASSPPRVSAPVDEAEWLVQPTSEVLEGRMQEMLGAPAPAPAPEPEPEPPSQMEEELKKVKRELALLKLSPQERYPEVLKDAGIDIEDAHQILDRIIVQLKPWVEVLHVVRSVTATVQTRALHDQRRLDRWAESTRPQLDSTVLAEANLNNMAASLLSYGERMFKGDDEAARYKDAYDFLVAMPYPAYRLLQTAVAEFDAKINDVFSEGYLENF